MTLWLVVTSTDVEKAQQTLDSSWREGASDEEIAAADHFVNHDGDEASCPACGTECEPGTEKCPDCGLRIG